MKNIDYQSLFCIGFIQQQKTIMFSLHAEKKPYFTFHYFKRDNKELCIQVKPSIWKKLAQWVFSSAGDIPSSQWDKLKVKQHAVKWIFLKGNKAKLKHLCFGRFNNIIAYPLYLVLQDFKCWTWLSNLEIKKKGIHIFLCSTIQIKEY